MSHKIALNFEDGVTRFIEARPGETVADAAYRLGINIPLDCRDGACGTCKCRVRVRRLRRRRLHRGRADRGGGGRGLCAGLPDAAEDRSGRCASPPPRRSARPRRRLPGRGARAVEQLSDDHHRLLARGRGASRLPSCRASTSTSWCRAAGSARSYSFSSPPGAEVAIIPGPRHPARPDERLSARARPSRATTMESRRPVRAASICATSSGRCCSWRAAPAWRRSCPCWAGSRRQATATQPIHMVYGVTNDADLVEVETARGLRRSSIPSFTFATCVADKASDHPRKGYVTAASRGRQHLNGGDVDVYLCGPPPMVERCALGSASRASTPANFHYEKFTPSGGGDAIANPPARREAAMTTSRTFRRQGRGRHRCGPGHRPRPSPCASPARAAHVALVDRSELVDEVRQELEAGGARRWRSPPTWRTIAGADSRDGPGAATGSAASTSWSTMSAARSGPSPTPNTSEAEIEAGDPPLAVPDAVVLPRGASGDAEAGWRRDRQRLVGGDARRQPGALCGGQGRRQRRHRLPRLRVCRARHPGGRRGARRHRGAAAAHPAQRRRRRTEQEKAWYQASSIRRSRPA